MKKFDANPLLRVVDGNMTSVERVNAIPNIGGVRRFPSGFFQALAS